ncbi:hypothetical protein LSCM1_03218 [Leishmania martiniquensis]|uniref:Uncharacterized protein n=1 Tax=Leishmania martiniquensis TaxID=1580590 RepID=A0A836GG57_9TRYP|nr:hypothetical protein LSCM1_03218 [Leishmania martiniquensis]
MPKRHRQPEPIDIESAAYHRSSQGYHGTGDQSLKSSASLRASSAAATSDVVAAAQRAEPVYSPGEIKLAKETRKKAKDFPATPESLVRHRRQLEAHAKRRRISFDKDGQPVNDDVDSGETTPNAQQTRPVPVPGTVSFPSLPGRTYSPASGRFGPASQDDGEDADAVVDFSSNDYVGDDGNQPSSGDSLLGGRSKEDSAAEEEEVELRQLRKAVAAADAQRREKMGDADEGSSGAGDSSGKEDSIEESGLVSSSNDDLWDISDSDAGEESESDRSHFSGESDNHEESEKEEKKGVDDAWGAHRRSGLTGGNSSEDDDGDDDSGDGVVTVDFGVFDMEASNTDGLLHLMDQLCPDRMNEVDRDELGLALLESPFTSVVRLQNNGEDATGEEAQEFYGLSSVLDVAHGQALYPAALRPLCDILQRCVWRQAASGIPPTDILTSFVGGGRVASSRAKCVWLISEYIRNIPLELTVQILEDLLDRLDAAAQEEKKGTAQTVEGAVATHERPIFATHPCMFAVLAKVQRATDAPVTLAKHAAPLSSGGGAEGAGGDRDAAAAAHRRHHNRGNHSAKKKSESAGGSGSSGTMSAPEPELDLTHYIFWREEDSVLYQFRDKRVATLVYRCRPQYDGQPAHEVPLSILFVLQYGAARQAVGEMRRRQTVHTAVERYERG